MIKTRIFLVLAFLFFLSYTGLLLGHESQRPVILGHYSPAFFALLIIYFLSLGFLLFLSLLPEAALKTLKRILKSLAAAPLIGKEPESPKATRRLPAQGARSRSQRSPAVRQLTDSFEVLFLILASVIFLSLSSIYFAKNERATDDEVAYLSRAIEIKERGGIGGFIRDVFTGRYLEANRHPLYILLLSLFARRDLSFFAQAKMMSLLFGLITVLVIYFVIRNHFGVIAAALGATFLCLNQAFLDASGKVACETLLVLFALLTWHFCTKAKPNWALAGVFSGLAYLTKASGLFLLLAILISLIIMQKLRTFKEEALWRVLAAFLLVAFPLLWRNSLVFKNPLYNKNQTAMWLDDWQDSYRPEYRENPPNLISYLRSHSRAQVLARMHQGLAVESFVLLRASGAVKIGLSGIMLGLIVLFFAGLKAVGDENKFRRNYTLTAAVILFLPLAWFAHIIPADRLILPIVPFIYAYGAAGLCSLLRPTSNVPGRKAPARAGRRLTALIIILLFLGIILIPSIFAAYGARPFSTPVLPQEYVALRQWMEGNIGPGQRYLKGPDTDFQFEWHSAIGGERLFFPLLENFDELNIYILRWRVDYCVITPQVIRERKKALQEYFGWEEKRGLYERKRPLLWQQVYRDPAARAGRIEFLVYKVRKRLTKKPGQFILMNEPLQVRSLISDVQFHGEDWRNYGK